MIGDLLDTNHLSEALRPVSRVRDRIGQLCLQGVRISLVEGRKPIARARMTLGRIRPKVDGMVHGRLSSGRTAGPE
jgi:hypothetical protein